METLRISVVGGGKPRVIRAASQDFRQRDDGSSAPRLYLPACWNFSLLIALVAVYFGFLPGELNFVITYGRDALAAVLRLILAPSFSSQRRDSGTFYHAKAQALARRINSATFLETPPTGARRS